MWRKKCVQLIGTLWTLACQASQSMEFSREEYWSGLPVPSPEDLPDSGIKLKSLASPAREMWILYHCVTWKRILSSLTFDKRSQTQGFPGDSDGKESAMWETQVRSLGQEDLLEKGTATHSSILAWRIPWTEEPGGPQSMVSQRAGYD